MFKLAFAAVLTVALIGQAQAASGKHMMRKAGGDPMHHYSGGGGAGAGKVRVDARPPRYRAGPHFLNPQPLPPG
jgi:hypothetical protein